MWMPHVPAGGDALSPAPYFEEHLSDCCMVLYFNVFVLIVQSFEKVPSSENAAQVGT